MMWFWCLARRAAICCVTLGFGAKAHDRVGSSVMGIPDSWAAAAAEIAAAAAAAFGCKCGSSARERASMRQQSRAEWNSSLVFDTARTWLLMLPAFWLLEKVDLLT